MSRFRQLVAAGALGSIIMAVGLVGQKQRETDRAFREIGIVCGSMRHELNRHDSKTNLAK
jgi:hypothetical protein